VSLLGLLLTLAIVGALSAAIPLLADRSSGNPDTVTVTPPGRSTSISGSTNAAGSDIAAAEVSACRTNYQAAETALSDYEAEEGSRPTKISEVQALIRDPLSSAFFQITIDPLRPGSLEVATPGHAASDGDANCETAGT
jgi:hypothetical protein